jgi:hypothetical protein
MLAAIAVLISRCGRHPRMRLLVALSMLAGLLFALAVVTVSIDVAEPRLTSVVGAANDR